MTSRDWQKAGRRKITAAHGTESIRSADLPSIPRRGRDPRPAKDPVSKATHWLVQHRQRLRDEGRNPVPELQREFGLSRKEACAAISRANEAESPR